MCSNCSHIPSSYTIRSLLESCFILKHPEISLGLICILYLHRFPAACPEAAFTAVSISLAWLADSVWATRDVEPSGDKIPDGLDAGRRRPPLPSLPLQKIFLVLHTVAQTQRCKLFFTQKGEKSEESVARPLN